MIPSNQSKQKEVRETILTARFAWLRWLRDRILALFR